MKKFLLLISALSLTVFTGCGKKNTENNNTEKNSIASEQIITDATETDNDVYFKNNEVKLTDLKIKITDTKVIKVGEPGNEYGKKPVLAIWYDTTNLSDKAVDPVTAWTGVFNAVQDNNPNSINELNVGWHPDEKYLDTQMETIKKGGTVTNAVSYELDDLETPVTLIAKNGLFGEKLGEQIFDIKELAK